MLDIAMIFLTYFYGGCKEGWGCYGAAVFTPEMTLLRSDAEYWGDEADTNNKAKAKGLVLAVCLACKLTSD